MQHTEREHTDCTHANILFAAFLSVTVSLSTLLAKCTGNVEVHMIKIREIGHRFVN